MSFPADSTVSADTVKPRKKRSRGGNVKKAKAEHAPPSDAKAFKMRKIRLRLTKEQQRILLRWMGGARFVYNNCVAYIRAGNPANRSELRQRFAADGSPLMQAHPWLKDIPYKIREQASDDVVKANEANKARREKDPKHRKWTFKFRTRKEPSAWTAGLVSQCFNRVNVEPRPETRRPRRDGQPHKETQRRMWTKLQLFKAKHQELGSFWAVEAIPPEAIAEGGRAPKPGKGALNYDCKLTRDFLGHFYLCVPVPAPPMAKTKPEAERTVVALDPGVRAFQTYYSPEVHGAYAEGSDGFARIYSLCEHLDTTVALRALRPTTKFLQKMYTDRCWRLRQRIRNLVDETHKKVSLDLVRRFDTVLIPDFKTKQMTQRKNRKDGRVRTIRSKTARSMLTWAHYRFRMRLIEKALDHGKEVVTVTEEYTSRTCGRCGHLNLKTSSKLFECEKCGVKMDRDDNGARNIFLKHVACPAA